jgi:hypothetical protein
MFANVRSDDTQSQQAKRTIAAMLDARKREANLGCVEIGDMKPMLRRKEHSSYRIRPLVGQR